MFKREKKNSYFQFTKKIIFLFTSYPYFEIFNEKTRERKKKNPFSTFNLTFSQRNSIDILKFYELEYQTNKFNEFLIFSEYWF